MDHAVHPDAMFGVGLVLASLAGLIFVAYLVGVARRGGLRVWPLGRIVSAVAGATALSVAGIGIPTMGPGSMVVPHVVTMMVAAPLLVAGLPLRLALSVLPSRARRGLTATLRSFAGSRRSQGVSVVLLPIEYLASMAVLFLTPLAGLVEESVPAHIAVHVYMLGCGLLFFAPVLDAPIVGGQLRRRTRIALAATAVPGIAVLGLVLVSGLVPQQDARANGLALLVSGVPAALAGVWAAARGRGCLSLSPGGADGRDRSMSTEVYR